MLQPVSALCDIDPPAANTQHARMTEEQARKELRRLLLMPNAWQPELDRLLDELQPDPRLMHQAGRLLVDKLPETGERYRPRMKQMADAFARRLRQMGDDRATLQRVAQTVVTLEEQRNKLEEEMDAWKACVAAMLGPSVEFDAGGLGIKVGPEMQNLRVTSLQEVPKEFLSMQPDRKAILAHFRATGQVLAGTQITSKRPAVRIWKTARGAGG
jgi:hypothetical protein